MPCDGEVFFCFFGSGLRFVIVSYMLDTLFLHCVAPGYLGGGLEILVMTRDLFYLFYYCWKGKGKRTQQAGNRTKRGLASFSFYFFPILYLEAGHASSCFFSSFWAG